jgi:hypothetical protein
MTDLDARQAAVVPEGLTHNARDLDAWTLCREGLMAGTLGTAALALGFLILDKLTVAPLYAPHVLGTALFTSPGGFDTPAQLPLSLGRVAACTVVYWLACAALGGMASRLLRVAAHQPGLGVGMLLLFIGCEGALLGVMMLGATPMLPALAWPSVLVGNLLTAAVLSGYRWHRHAPRTPQEL